MYRILADVSHGRFQVRGGAQAAYLREPIQIRLQELQSSGSFSWFPGTKKFLPNMQLCVKAHARANGGRQDINCRKVLRGNDVRRAAVQRRICLQTGTLFLNR